MITGTSSKMRRLAVNSMLGVASWAVPIILTLVATPILIGRLGPDGYGIYALIAGFLSYSFAVGIGRATVKFTAEFNAVGRDRAVTEVISTSFLYAVITGTAAAVILIFTAPFLVRTVLLIPQQYESIATAAFYIASLGLVFPLVSNVFQSALQGLNRFGSFYLISNILAIVLPAGNIGVALLGYGVPQLQAWNAGVFLIGAIAYYAILRRSWPRTFAKPSTEVLSLIFKASIGIILYQLIGYGIYFFERTWVTRTAGPEGIAHYSIAFLVAFYLHSFVGSFSTVLFASMNELLESKAKLIALYDLSLKLILGIVTFAVVFMLCAGRQLLDLWLGAQLSANVYTILAIHTVSIGILTLMILPWQINEVFRATRLNVVIALIWSAVGIPAMVLLSSNSGSIGVAAGRTLAMAAGLPLLFYAEHRFLGGIRTNVWLASVLRLFVAGGLIASLYFVLFDVFGPVALFFAPIVGASVFVLTLVLTGYFDQQERSDILALLPLRRSDPESYE